MKVEMATHDMKEVATGEVKAARAPSALQCLALGSCVAVILHDPVHAIGGIAHIMLPGSTEADPVREERYKHANYAIPELIRQMEGLGADRAALSARLVGGALVIPDTQDIGKENITAVRRLLAEAAIPILDEHIGGNAGRSVTFMIASGELEINGKMVLPPDVPSSRPIGRKKNEGASVIYIKSLEEKVAERTKELHERVQDLNNVRKATFNLLEDLEKEREKLIEEKAKDEGILASIGDGLVVVDKDLRIILINRAATAATGWESEEVLGKTWSELIHLATEEGKSVASGEEPLFLAIHAQTVTSSGTVYRYTRKDGTHFPVAITVSPITVENEHIGAIAVFRDVTGERAIDKAKTEFVSLASHQLKTPLTSVGWYAEMLLNGRGGKMTDQGKTYLQKIFNNNHRMVALVNSLLNVSRIEMGTFSIAPESVHFLEIADSIFEELAADIQKKKLQIEKKYDQSIPPIQADPQLVRIIFQNLLSNAVKYTDEDGKITLAITLKEPDVCIQVTDTGYGIPKVQQAQIFTKLFRADNAREKDTDGTGLGLYIVKAVVEQSGGKIWFTSKQNQGTDFYVTLPLGGMRQKTGAKGLL